MRHGGDIDGARRQFGEPRDGWLDLSTGINPNGYPVGPLPSDAWSKLPQSGAELRLLSAARSAYGVPEAADICCAPGTQVLIQLAARLRPAARVSVIGPTYSEHARAWAGEGCHVTTVTTVDVGAADVVVLVNPNNPDGRVVPAGEIAAWAQQLTRRGGLLVVDEAFADVDPQVSVMAHVTSPGLLVLRSFGKFFGLAGLRLGFAIGEAAEVGRLRAWLGPWATSGPALEVGTAALSDQAWIERSRAGIAEQNAVLVELLRQAGLSVIGGVGLFTLAKHHRARDLHVALARRGIWVRRFDEHPTWLRFGLPGGHMPRFAVALADAVEDVEAQT